MNKKILNCYSMIRTKQKYFILFKTEMSKATVRKYAHIRGLPNMMVQSLKITSSFSTIRTVVEIKDYFFEAFLRKSINDDYRRIHNIQVFIYKECNVTQPIFLTYERKQLINFAASC